MALLSRAAIASVLLCIPRFCGGASSNACVTEHLEDYAGFKALSTEGKWYLCAPGEDICDDLDKLRRSFSTSSAEHQHNCSRRGHRFFEILLKFNADSNATKRMRIALQHVLTEAHQIDWSAIFVGLCAPHSCDDDAVRSRIWPFFAQRRLRLRVPRQPTGDEFHLAQTTSVRRGLVKSQEQPPILNAGGVLLPALLLLLSSHPTRVLAALHASASALNISQVRLDFGLMPELSADGMLTLPSGVTSILVDVGASVLTEFAAPGSDRVCS
mmetsp:Transcript_23801/g.80428  ORF Transcript_23801/g.80428 Transcript_23801/m.80428 type:complete len:270 (+) Transcript_23801:144-953(+)